MRAPFKFVIGHFAAGLFFISLPTTLLSAPAITATSTIVAASATATTTPIASFMVTPASAAIGTAHPSNVRTVKAQYDVYMGSVKVATMKEVFTRTQDTYHAESVSRAVGLLAMFKPETIRATSTGAITAQGLRPHTFIQSRKLDTNRNTRADFNWTAQTIALSDKNGVRTVPLPAGTQDRLSAMYQFLYTSALNTSVLTFNMTNGSRVGDYVYQITPNQNVTTPLGTFKALYLHNPPKEHATRTEIWLVPEYANFPYKMNIIEADGREFSQVLTHLKITP